MHGIFTKNAYMTPSEQITSDIIALYEQYGNEDYDGEPVSQASHMIQCAMLAIREEAGPELVLGSFLHDIGHLLKHRQQTEAMGSFGVVDHEGIGARFLRKNGFSERVCAVVENHVQAKRFLVATEPSYKQNLSVASLQTLQWQGGAMSATEAEEFRLHPCFDEIIRVRIWDEEAKNTGVPLLPFSYFGLLIHQHLLQNPLHES